MYDEHVRAGVLSLACAVCLFGGALQAQVRGGGMLRSGSGSATMRSGGTRIFHAGETSVCRHCGRRFRHARFGPGFPFTYDDFFYPAEYDDGYPLAVGAPPPQIIVLRDEAGSGSSTMIDMHNSPGAKVIEVPASVSGELGAPSTATRAMSRASTVFVLLDGHRIEARRYMVVGESLYITDTRRTSKTIALDQLDVTATLSANRERGIELQMPSGPSEVLLSF